MKILTFMVRKNFLFFCLTFFIPMLVYLFTLAPTVTAEDSGELITASYTLGIAHPSGYPLYTILGKIFTFIPLGTIAWRVNLMSAFFGALTISLLYLVIEKITRNKLISFSSSLMFSFSSIFWSQSVIAEVYTLNTFFVALLFLILINWKEKKEAKYLMWFSFLCGLSLTNHTAMILLMPFFILYILWTKPKICKEFKLVFLMLFLFILGLLVYLYIPLRAWQRADFNWGPINSWRGIFDHISRKQYNDFSPFASQYGKFGLMLNFFIEVINQFHLPTLILAFAGAVYLWIKDKKVALLSVGIFVGSSILIIYLRKFGWSTGIEYVYRVYYLPAFLIVVIWFGVIISYLYNFLSNILKSRISMNLTKAAFGFVLISLPFSFLLSNYQKVDLSDFWLVYDYAKNTLDSMEPGSIYYFSGDGSMAGDTEIFSLVYLKKVEKYRSDIDIVSEHQFFYKDVQLTLPEDFFKLEFEDKRRKFFNLLHQIKDRSLYTNFAVTQKDNDLGLFSISNGFTHRVYEDIKEARSAEFSGYFPSLRNLVKIDVNSEHSLTSIASRYYYNMAYLYLILGQNEKSQNCLITAFNLDIFPFNHEYRRFIDYRSEWLAIN